MKVYKKAHPDSTQRRLRVIGRLEAQLVKGMKPIDGEWKHYEVALTETDKTRINKELTILKSRI